MRASEAMKAHLGRSPMVTGKRRNVVTAVRRRVTGAVDWRKKAMHAERAGNANSALWGDWASRTRRSTTTANAVMVSVVPARRAPGRGLPRRV